MAHPHHTAHDAVEQQPGWWRHGHEHQHPPDTASAHHHHPAIRNAGPAHHHWHPDPGKPTTLPGHHDNPDDDPGAANP